jgi:hypothetical protein
MAYSRSRSLSSAILYLAIVAIWAFMLVPRWLRRSHPVVSSDSVPTADMDGDSPVEDSALPVEDSALPTGESAQPFEAAQPDEPPVPVRERPPIGRAAILQARRRMLTTLVTLVAVTAVCRAGGLTPLWTCVPPVGLLGMYLLLLREAALADAESEQRRREAARIRAARQRAREAWAAREPEPTAEIIDISSRVGDQLYDQYADATMRAVGD